VKTYINHINPHAYRHRVAALEALFDDVRREFLQRKFSDLSIGLRVNPGAKWLNK